MIQLSQKYIGNNESVSISIERSGDIRFSFDSLDLNTDTVSFEFPINGNKSPKTVQAVYDILTANESISLGEAHAISNIAIRTAEIGKILEITVNDTNITITGSDKTKKESRSISVEFEGTPIQVFQFHGLMIAILEDNKNYIIGI